MNSVNLVGRLTKDPELRYSPSGVPMARFTLAVNRQFKKEGQPDADFISCLTFNKTAENLANFMRKGSLIGLIGRIQTGSYEKESQRVYTTDVIADNIQFLDSRNSGEGGNAPQPNNNAQQQQQNAPQQQQYQAPPQQQYQQPQYQQQSGGYQQQPSYQQQNQQQNYTRMDEDPFANSKGPIEVSEDDLPF